jgi:hypothetical protein
MKTLQNFFSRTILVVGLICLLGGCDDRKEIKVNAQTNKTERVYKVGDTLYYNYITGHNVMFIIEKIDVEQKVFIGRQSNIYDATIFSKQILSFREYSDERN